LLLKLSATGAPNSNPKNKEESKSEENTAQDTSTQSDEFEALYAQIAAGMAYADGQLMLNGIGPTTLYFSDRPNRITGHITTEEFFDSAE
jgi:hypothetical protein